MGREVKRVPVGFDWPLDRTWQGYFTPEWLHGKPCPDCKNGYSRHAEFLHDLWYGNAPFDPSFTGSEHLTAATPAVRAFAERNVSRSRGYYGAGEEAIDREARRLADMWNGQWCHHLTQEDVDALVDGGRLYDFTHTWSKETRWQPKDPPYRPTAAEVNEWSIGGLGHDAINAGIVIRANCERVGQPYVCGTCDGHASVEAFIGQRGLEEAWQPIEPPAGEGWQVWETVSEGSPITPAFATADELIDHLATVGTSWDQKRGEGPWRRSAAESFVRSGWAPTGMVKGNGPFLSGGRDADRMDAASA